jgi:hypothetical protein
MRTKVIAAVLAFAPYFVASAQTPVPPPTSSADRAADADGTHGKVKEFTAGQKLVIAVDNAPDKSYDLTDKDVTVKVPQDLKVGDAVKVAEKGSGKGKTIEIAKHTGGTGDADRRK